LKTFKYKIPWKAIHWNPSCSVGTEKTEPRVPFFAIFQKHQKINSIRMATCQALLKKSASYKKCNTYFILTEMFHIRNYFNAVVHLMKHKAH